MDKLIVAAVQLCSGTVPAANLAAAASLIEEAASKGAQLVVLPENVALMAESDAGRAAYAKPEACHPAVAFFCDVAAKQRVWLVAGSIAVAQEGNGKLANRCLVISPDGVVCGRYDKIHLFDAEPRPGESYRESHSFAPGAAAVCVSLPWGKLGLSICYDLRFATLFRSLAKAGARLIVCPAAFTHTTGTAHWQVLVRARAIETGCYLVAAAQTGCHAGGRQTYGHSLIVDPWGTICAEAGESPGVLLATLDLGQNEQVRAALPSLQHDRVFTEPEDR